MKSYDLTLDNKGRATTWNRGFFEHVNSLSFNQFNAEDYIELKNETTGYRVNKDEYNSHKEVFDKFIN